MIPFNSASGVVISSSTSISASTSLDDSSLYLMVSNEYDPTERLDKSDFPVFSIRYLATTQNTQSENNLESELQLKQPLFQSKYPIESMNYDQTIFNPDFHMKIIYSFKHNGFVYFLFTITNKMLSESCNRVDAESTPLNNQTANKIVTRMLRICDTKWSSVNNGDYSNRHNRDSNNQETLEQISNLYAGSATNSATLTETVIECDDELTGTKHHLLQSAHFHELPSSKHANTYTDDSILFLTFNSSTSASSSALCKIRIKEIDNHFVSMLRKCLDGDNNYAELVSPYSNKNTWKTPCRCSIINDFSRKPSQSDMQNDRRLFCHNDFFNYINSRQTLTLKSVSLDVAGQIKPITSIVSLNMNQHNKIMLAFSTLDAQIILNSYDQATNRAEKYDQISLLDSSIPLSVSSALNINLALVDTSSKFKSNNFSSSFQRSLFVTYDRYLFKINLQNCEQFQTCDSCLGLAGEQTTANPFCGWCVYEQKCTLKQTCLAKQANIDYESSERLLSSLWLTKGLNDTCPSIIDIKPSRYLNPMVYSSASSAKQELLLFNLNLKLLPSIQYYCDINTSTPSSMSRVTASYINENSLRCDLMQIKSKFEQMIRSNPIERRYANVSLQIRTSTGSKSSLSTSLIASTNLYAFNCSYFKDCSQCLNRQLAGSCIWCASNSKCIFSKQQSLASKQSILSSADLIESAECPNEIEYYQRPTNLQKPDVCTSFSMRPQTDVPSKIEIPYSADSNLGQFVQLYVKNRHLNYQFKFKCLFTRTRSAQASSKLTSSDLNWLAENEMRANDEIPFDCVYSPYSDVNQLEPDMALQTVYMSVWWSSSLQTNKLTSLAGWNQIKFGAGGEDGEQDEESASEKSFVEISVINCKVKASSCGKCMDKQLIDLGCGWCRSTSKCTMRKDCPASSLNSWMNELSGSYCANPTVQEMRPMCGPKVSGGTQLVLAGENLGNSAQDVRVKMKSVAANLNKKFSFGSYNVMEEDLDCQVVPEFYVKSTRIVCRTKPIATKSDKNGVNEFSVYVQTNTNSPNSIYSSFNQSNQFIFKYVVSIFEKKLLFCFD